MECQDYGDEIKNVLDEPDISEEETNNMMEGFQQFCSPASEQRSNIWRSKIQH